MYELRVRGKEEIRIIYGFVSKTIYLLSGFKKQRQETPRKEIESARIKKGITQKELAQKIGTKQSAIARFEAGNINPSLGFLEKMVEVMGYKLTISLSK